MEYLVILGIVYLVLDAICSVAFGKCIMPGLKCRACKGDE